MLSFQKLLQLFLVLQPLLPLLSLRESKVMRITSKLSGNVDVIDMNGDSSSNNEMNIADNLL